MTTTANPFAALLDPITILSACAQSGALDALPVSARRCADRARADVAAELAAHDAAVEELYQKQIAKAAQATPAKARKAVAA